MAFGSECACGPNGSMVIIYSDRWVRIATDGTGEVAGYLKSFAFTPPSAKVPLSAGLPSASMTNGSQTIYYVPSDCMTQFDTARTNTFEGLRNEIDAYVTAMGGDTQLMLGPPPSWSILSPMTLRRSPARRLPDTSSRHRSTIRSLCQPLSPSPSSRKAAS